MEEGQAAYLHEQNLRRFFRVSSYRGHTGKVALRTDATGISSTTGSAHTPSSKSVRSATTAKEEGEEPCKRIALQADAAEWWS